MLTILRPSTYSSATGVTYQGFGVTAFSASVLSDNDDSSGAVFTNFFGDNPARTVISAFPDIALATAQRIAGVDLRVRYSTAGGGVSDFNVLLANSGGTTLSSGHWTDGAVDITARNGNQIVTNFSGAEWTQADVNGLQARLDLASPSSDLFLRELYMGVDIRSKPITVATGQSGAAATRRPSATWTFDSRDGEAQSNYTVKCYTQTEYNGGGFNPDTTTVTVASVVAAAGDVRAWQVPTGLADGTYRFYIKAAKLFNGVAWYSDWSYIQFTISDAPLTPTKVTPVNGALINTDVPNLTAVTAPSALGARTRIEWNLATDVGFTTNLKIATQPTSALLLSGTQSLTLPDSEKISQGAPWHIRARAIDEFGDVGPWSSANQFTSSHPPTTAGHTPTGGTTLNYGSGSVVFRWKFSDPSAVDTQSAYQLAIERNSDALSILDTGQVTDSTAGDDFTSRAIPSTYKDQVLRWRVRVWDSDGVVGPWSPYQLFSVSDLPVVAIQTPANAGTANNPQPQVTWTFSASGGRTETAYRVLFTLAGATVLDSGWLAGSLTSYTPPSPVLSNAHTYVVTVYAKDNTGLVGSDANTFTTAWVAPAAPPQTIDASTYGTLGYVKITWDNSAVDSTFFKYAVWRRESGVSSWTVLYETITAASTYEFHDRFARSGIVYSYVVVQYAMRFGTPVPSVGSVSTVTPVSEDYWLLHPTDPSADIRLRHVTADSFTDEFEQETLDIVERGRHVEYGTEWGFSGSISFKLYDETDTTARAQRLALEALKRLRIEVYLRNPFGDLWQSASGDIQITREPGVGQREISQATMTYQQVA